MERADETTILPSVGADNSTITNIERFIFNVTDGTKDADEQFVSTWIIIICLIIILIGACINAVLVLALLRSRRNGTLALILQLAFVDTITLYSAVTEIWCLNNHTWVFSSEFCPLFLGTETITNTLNLYLTVCLNFHVISLWNLYKRDKESTTNRNPLTACNNDSIECLVTKSENSGSSRNVTIDYRRRRNDVSIIFPAMLVWFITMSLSVPEYTLSSTLKIPNSHTLCTIVDLYYGKLLQHMLLLFRVIVPVPLLLLSFLMLLLKFCCKQITEDEIQSVLTKKSYKMETLLLFCIFLNGLYIFTSFQRQFFYFFHVLMQEYSKGSISNFKTPPLYNNFISNHLSTYLSILHYFSCIIRPLLYIFVLPKFKFLVKSKLCITYKN